MKPKEFYAYKERLTTQLTAKAQEIPERPVRAMFYRSSIIRQLEAEKNLTFTADQTADLIRAAIYPDLRTEEERQQDEKQWKDAVDKIMKEE